MNRTQLLAGIRRLAEAEAAPYNEAPASAVLQAWLKELDIPFRADGFGNTFARVRQGMPKRPLAFVVGLDHPGLRVTSVADEQIHCAVDGDLPLGILAGAKIVFPRTDAGRISAKVDTSKEATPADGSHPGEPAEVVASLVKKGTLPDEGDCAILEMPAWSRTGTRVKARAAASVGACGALVAGLVAAKEAGTEVDAWGLFVRASAPGYQGVVAMALDSTVPREMFVVAVGGTPSGSGCALGGGPVARLGDRHGPFDPRATAIVCTAAQTLTSQEIAHQRAITHTSDCEASAFGAFGYPSTGIAIPTQGHRNHGAKAIVPEEIDLVDLEGAAALIAAAASRAASGVDDVDARRNELVRATQQGRETLRLPLDPKTGAPVRSLF